MVKNPLEIGVAPTSEEFVPAYREGKVAVLTFENQDEHICYGLASDGTVWDFCSLGDKGIANFQDQLSDAQIELALEILQDFRISLEGS